MKSEKPKPEMIRFAYLRKKNKRIYIGVFRVPDDTITVTIRTTRLVGTWKERHIIKAEVHYGYESISVITDVLTMLFQDPVFLKASNREQGQVEKDKMRCLTDINFMNQ